MADMTYGANGLAMTEQFEGLRLTAFLLWDHAGGVVVPGLLKRRQAEMALFQS